MENFDNIAYTLGGTLLKLINPMRTTDRGEIVGYLCEHKNGWRTFVALADLKMTDTIKKDLDTAVVDNGPAAIPKQPVAPIAAEQPPVAPIVAEQPPDAPKKRTRATKAQMAERKAAEARVAVTTVQDTPLTTPAPAVQDPANTGGTPVVDVPKKRTRATKAQMAERKAVARTAKTKIKTVKAKRGRPAKVKRGRPAKAKRGRPAGSKNKK